MLSKVIDKAAGVYRFVRTYGQHWHMAVEAIFSFRCTLKRLRGTLKGTDHRIDVLYAGRGMNYAWLVQAIFDDFSEQAVVETTLPACGRALQRMEPGADAVVVDIGWPYHRLFNRKGLYAEVPDWLNLIVDLGESWDGVVRNFRRTARKHDLRRIRRNGYRCDRVHDLRSIEHFYDEMYVPFVKHRFSSASAITPRRHVLRRARDGYLLRVLREGEVVAAGIVYPEGEIMFSLWLGMPRHYLDSPPEAAMSALYYFGLGCAFDDGYRYFDFGGTRAFLNDGAFQFKRRWGPLIEDEFSPNSILVKPAANRNGALFCRRVPVLRRADCGLEAVFVSGGERIDAGTFERLEKEYGCAGIDRMTVIEPGQGSEILTVPNDGGGCECRVVRCPLAEFPAHYAGTIRSTEAYPRVTTHELAG